MAFASRLVARISRERTNTSLYWLMYWSCLILAVRIMVLEPTMKMRALMVTMELMK